MPGSQRAYNRSSIRIIKPKNLQPLRRHRPPKYAASLRISILVSGHPPTRRLFVVWYRRAYKGPACSSKSHGPAVRRREERGARAARQTPGHLQQDKAGNTADGMLHATLVLSASPPPSAPPLCHVRDDA